MAWSFAIPLALSVAGTAAKAGGQYKGAQAQSQTDLYKAGIARKNAQLLGEAADRTVQAGIVNSDVAGLRTEETVGKTKATQGALNIDPNSPTAANVRASEAEAGRLDQLTTLNDAQLKGWGYRVRQQGAEDTATLDEASATDATKGGALAAGGTVLAGASQLPWGWITGGSGGGGNNSTVVSGGV